MDERTKEMRAIDQRLAGLGHEVWQLRLATEEDVPADIKTRKRAEDTAIDQAKHAVAVLQKGTMPARRVTSFGMTAEPPDFHGRVDVLVDIDAAAPKPCPSPVETRTPTAANDLFIFDTASTAMKTILPRPFFLGASVKRPRKVTAE